MMDEAKVMEVLRRVEWVGQPPYCPWCYYWQSEGHGKECKLAALLAEDGDLPTVDLTPEHTSEGLTPGAAPKLASLIAAELSKLFKLLGAPEGATLCAWDDLDPDERFVIRRVARTQGAAGEGEASE